MSQSKAEQALALARKLAASSGNWIDLHNALFGIGGKLVSMFPTPAERTAFSQSPEFEQIQTLISDMRDKKGDPTEITDQVARANGAINVRLPRAIHAALLAEAAAQDVSLNQLCVVKLCVQLDAIIGSK